MSSSNRGIVLAIGGAVALAAAVALFFLLYWQPRSEAKRVQTEVETWGAEWEKARVCLVGDKPLAADGYEAMALRELTEPDLKTLLRTCTDNLKAIKRGEGYDAGGKIEAAWNELKDARKKLAKAHAWRTALKPLTGIDADDVRNDLAESITMIDEGYDELRLTVGLGPAPRAGKALPKVHDAAAVTMPGGGDLDVDEVEVTGALVGALASVPGKKGAVQVELTAADKRFLPSGEWIATAADSAPWGAWLVGKGQRRSPRQASLVLETEPVVVMAGPLGKDGEPLADSAVEIFKIPKVKRPPGAGPDAMGFGPEIGLYAAGAGALRVVGLALYHHRDNSVAVMSSTDGGKSFRSQTLSDGNGVGVRFNRRRLLVNRGERTVFEYAPTLGTLDPTAWQRGLSICFANGASWHLLDTALHVHTAGKRDEVSHEGNLVGGRSSCNDTRYLAARRDADGSNRMILRTTVCDRQHCTGTKMPMLGKSYSLTVGDNTGAVIAQRLGDILLAFRFDDAAGEWKPVAGAQAPNAWKLSGIVEWSGALQAVFKDGNRLRIAKLGAL